MKLPTFLTFPRKPDFKITNGDGSPYMHRWFLIPRNKLLNIYLHNILASDDDRALHDHRAHNISLLFRGSYIEHFQNERRVRNAPCFIFRKGETPHRLQLYKDHFNSGRELSTWSIFIKLKDYREWGFWCAQGWRHWEEFVKKTEDGNSAGKGCD
jgi:hypothetical protein